VHPEASLNVLYSQSNSFHVIHFTPNSHVWPIRIVGTGYRLAHKLRVFARIARRGNELYGISQIRGSHPLARSARLPCVQTIERLGVDEQAREPITQPLLLSLYTHCHLHPPFARWIPISQLLAVAALTQPARRSTLTTG
jgi:hypothetical protein